MYFNPELEKQDKRDARISAGITAGIVIVLLLLTFIWTVYRNRVPPPGEKQYEMVGAVDFGDYREGSKDINNFEKAVEDPAETPPPPQVESPPVKSEPDPTPPPKENITTTKPSQVTEPTPPKVTKPETKPDIPKDKPKPKEDPVTPPKKPQEPAEKPSDKPSDKPAGSNQGSGEPGSVGNAGTSDIKVLDPDGLYSFGTGEGAGLQGRSPISLTSPKYDSQQEGELQFEFIIQPDGSVSYAKMIGLTTKTDLKRAGEAAIRSWRFSPLPPGNTMEQKVRVTIKFRLRG